MRLKSLSVVILALFSINSLAALHLEGARLIKHEEWHNVRLPQKFINETNDKVKTSSLTTAASAAHDYGDVNTNAYAHGTTAYNIRNDKNFMENYYVDRYLCIHHTSCAHSRDTIYVDPNGRAYDTGSPIITAMYFSKIGDYLTQCVIDISGSNHSHATGLGTLTIR